MKKLTLEQRQVIVITNIEDLLSQTKELGDFGKSKVIDSEAVLLAMRALEHLKQTIEVK